MNKASVAEAVDGSFLIFFVCHCDKQGRCRLKIENSIFNHQDVDWASLKPDPEQPIKQK